MNRRSPPPARTPCTAWTTTGRSRSSFAREAWAFRLDEEGNRTDVMPASERQIDGIEMTDDGGFLMSGWGDQVAYRVGGDGSVSQVVGGLEAPADIGYDRARNRVLVPLFNANEVHVVPLG